MKSVVIGASSDLGVHIDGAKLGPIQLINDIRGFYKDEIISFSQPTNIIKSRNISDRSKNKYEINELNEKMYKSIIEKMKDGCFPITIGGDTSVIIAPTLADTKINEEVGMIFIGAHPSYDTFTSTVTGNMNELALSAVTGYECEELTYFHKGELIQSAKCVVVGVREMSKDEKDNLRYSGINVFTTNDLKQNGIKDTLAKAFEIASYKTRSIHICFNLDIIDPEIAPGVSIPIFEGISDKDAIEICDIILENFEKVSSFDLVELNPLRDIDRKTEQIALNILAKVINKLDTLPDKKMEEESPY